MEAIGVDSRPFKIGAGLSTGLYARLRKNVEGSEQVVDEETPPVRLESERQLTSTHPVDEARVVLATAVTGALAVLAVLVQGLAGALNDVVASLPH